jgi:hypothetical protein
MLLDYDRVVNNKNANTTRMQRAYLGLGGMGLHRKYFFTERPITCRLLDMKMSISWF